MFGYGLLEGVPDIYNSFPFPTHQSWRMPQPGHPTMHPELAHTFSPKTPGDIATRRRFLTDGSVPFTGKTSKVLIFSVKLGIKSSLTDLCSN